jgi:ribose transport system permease protein
MRRLLPVLVTTAVFVAGFILCSLQFPHFASTRVVANLLTDNAFLGIVAVGMTFVIISGGIDLSVGSMIALTTVIIGLEVRDGRPPVIAAALGIGVAAACGLVNGSVVSLLRVGPFIVTLGTLLVYRGLAKWLAQNQSIYPPRTWLNDVMAPLPPGRQWMVFSPGVWVLIGLALIVVGLLRYTRLGRHAFAVGSNEQTARLCGIAPWRVKAAVYAIGGLLTGAAGLMQYSRLGIGDPTVAVGLELDVIAAVVIGGGSLSGGEGSVVGTLVGALIMSVIRSGCSQMGLDNYVQEIVTGVVIVLAVALDRVRHRRAS